MVFTIHGSISDLYDIRDGWNQIVAQKRGHIKLKSMRRIVSKKAIIGVHSLKIEEEKICGNCQIGKQTKMSHKKLQYFTTSKIIYIKKC